MNTPIKNLLVALLITFPTIVFTQTPVLVKNIHPIGGSEPMYLTNVNGTLFFQANDGGNGEELWKSDGTYDGTVMVKDINESGG
ncbi:MAG: hypothetical protein KDE26_17680, partial [Bacteroidetes bacterium]|nr:hypothetical protein [Bacteroidota bacterium]